MSTRKFREEALFLIIGSLIVTTLVTSIDAQPQQSLNHKAINEFEPIVLIDDGNYKVGEYYRPRAGTKNLRLQLKENQNLVGAHLENVDEFASRPSFIRIQDLATVYIETESRNIQSGKKFFVQREEEYVLLPFALKGKRAEAIISVDFDGKMYFTTPHFISPENKPIMVYIERDDLGNEYVLYPYRDQQGALYRVQLWVRGTERFHARELKQYFYEKHGYHLIDAKEKLPEWMKVTYNEPGTDIKERTKSKVEEMGKPSKLTIQWNPSSCLVLIEKREWVQRKKCELGIWRVHGLWTMNQPRYHKEMRSYCLWAVQNGHFPLVNLPLTLARTLKKIMFNSYSSEVDETFWTFEYCSHGRHMFTTAEDYFRKIIELFDIVKQYAFSHNVTELETHEKIWTFDEFLENALVENVRRLVDIRCHIVSKRYAVVLDLRFCFDSSNKLIACDTSGKEKCIRFGNYDIKGIIHQPKFESFPYMLLTIVWLPSQMTRVKQISTKKWLPPFRRKWVIHKLCQSTRFEHLLGNYQGDRVPLQDSADAFLRQIPKELEKIIDQDWPFIGDRFSFHKINWKKCGLRFTLLRREEFQNPLRYIEKTLEMARQLLISNWDIPLDVYMNASTLRGHIARFVGPEKSAILLQSGSLILDCMNKKNPQTQQEDQLLLKIHACYTLDYQLIACPPSEINLIPGQEKMNQVRCSGLFMIPSSN